MRVFIAVLVLIFSLQSWTKADDISEFEIEGMSVGDSLLEHFSKEEVKDFFEKKHAINYYPKSKKFLTLGVYIEGTMYDYIYFGLKEFDNKYIIYNIDGYQRMEYQTCLEEIESVTSDIKQLFSKDSFSQEVSDMKHDGDKSGNSIIFSHDFVFVSGGVIRAICTNWGKEMEADYYFDNFTISIGSKKFDEWIQNEAY